MTETMKTLFTASAIGAIAMLSACATPSVSMSSQEMAAASGQTTGVDMQGNVVEFDDKFTFGGDNMAAYNDGLLGTGTKDPAVCGSFSASKCSMSHLAK